jgi:putative thiamine transport system substrate-binding protein
MKLPLTVTLSLWLTLTTSALADWKQTLDVARGQTVYWNAWGGDERTNTFIKWVGEQTEANYGVKVNQVKLSDTSEAVTRVLSEKAAGKNKYGSVDLIWINGPNFLTMKNKDLLHGPFVRELPNAKYLDLKPDSLASVDFTTPVKGMESPWRLAKFVFIYDSARINTPPSNMTELLNWATEHPGRFTHPDPSNFMGVTFLKQALIELAPDVALLQKPVTQEIFSETVAHLWEWYDALKPNLWRGGKTFPKNQSIQQQLLNDNEVDISMSFDPASTAAAILQGLLPETARVFVPESGSIGNISFVAIPYNASHIAGAKVVANFLLQPSTQAHMQNIEVLGSFSVLDPTKLNKSIEESFSMLPSTPALPSIHELGPTLMEPHASWMIKLIDEWANRYTK